MVTKYCGISIKQNSQDHYHPLPYACSCIDIPSVSTQSPACTCSPMPTCILSYTGTHSINHCLPWPLHVPTLTCTQAPHYPLWVAALGCPLNSYTLQVPVLTFPHILSGLYRHQNLCALPQLLASVGMSTHMSTTFLGHERYLQKQPLSTCTHMSTAIRCPLKASALTCPLLSSVL